MKYIPALQNADLLLFNIPFLTGVFFPFLKGDFTGELKNKYKKQFGYKRFSGKL